ncbi:MAG: ribonuclease [Ruminococcaceae bacterium]|nr:ribonuclease [Oscillospiraceae bacterium]
MMKKTIRWICFGLFLLLSASAFTACDRISQDDVISVLEDISAMLDETSGETATDAVNTETGAVTETKKESATEHVTEAATEAVTEVATEAVTEPETAVTEEVVSYGEYYYDVENVVLYLDTYGELPENYMTKEEAQDLGWSGGSVEKYQDGAAIGGNRFGNYENLLPDSNWIECDIDTENERSRGAKRLVFSLEDGLYYYTDDHYETFVEVYINEDGEVEYK